MGRELRYLSGGSFLLAEVGCVLGFGALQFPLGRAGWGSKRRMLCVGLLVTWGGLLGAPPVGGGGVSMIHTY